MLNNCAVSCDTDADDEGEAEETPPRTMNQGMAHVYPDEDAAIGAFRFAERYSMHYIRGTETVIPTAVVLDVARALQKSLATPDGVARPAPDHVLCSSANSKRKPCSAGKLWKRAEEMRKADMHDAAGADLLRALLKSGLEADFVQRCERGLQWAFGSIRRQREREAREAIEEAKLEQRRQEEREAMEEAEGRKREYEADFVKFGRGLGEVLRETLAAAATSRAKGAEYAEATVDANGSVLTEDAAEAAAGHVANNKAAGSISLLTSCGPSPSPSGWRAASTTPPPSRSCAKYPPRPKPSTSSSSRRAATRWRATTARPCPRRASSSPRPPTSTSRGGTTTRR